MASTYSESWYQVADLKLALLPTVKIHKQVYRNQLWYVLQDSCSEKYFRVQPAAYLFLSYLSAQKTVDEVWSNFIEHYPDIAPTQEEVISLLSQLHHMNLLFYRSTGDNHGIFERKKKTENRQRLSYLTSFLFFRLPLWNPNDFLKRNMDWLSFFFSKAFVVVWVITLLLGGSFVIERMDDLQQQTQGILSVDNLILLFISMFALKIFHEMGHATVCRKYGGNVYNMGLVFIALTPLPYVDASASWSMRSRWQRAMVGFAGMYVELFFAAISAIVWSQTGAGVVNSMAFNIMLIGSISSIFFNGNPLIKFDAYYILSDLIDIPNLYQNANKHWLYLFNRFLLGTQGIHSPAENHYETQWYFYYGLFSFVYRAIIAVVITLYMADISLFLGGLMLLVMLFIWLFNPLYKLGRYVIASPECRHNRLRAIFVSATSLVVAIVVLFGVPVSHTYTVSGVVQAEQKVQLFAESGGELSALYVTEGESVTPNQLLMTFNNPELDLEYDLTGQQLIEVRWLQRQAIDHEADVLEALNEREKYLLNRLDEMDIRLSQLSVYAQQAGVWVGSLRAEHIRSYVSKGQQIGTIVSPNAYRFIGVVPQEKSSDFLREEIRSGEVRLNGRFNEPFMLYNIAFLPYQKQILPSGALAIAGGGSIYAKPDQTGNMLAIEPYFEIHAVLSSEQAMSLHDGEVGEMRVALTPEPLAYQWIKGVRQLLQTRYHL